jgi:beta-galactosidase
MECCHSGYDIGKSKHFTIRTKQYLQLFLILVSAALYTSAAFSQTIAPNDHIFPAAAIARPVIDFDSKGFIINGKRTFLVSAGIEYSRVPRALWYDRLLRLKRGGFNCIEIYTIWNYHEAHEGKFDFNGDHDLDFFLKLIKQLGMYAIVRVGPYYCAEWESGGYPVWLRFKPGLRVREPNTEFEKYVGRFFDTLFPVITRNQIHEGGAVIMVQLENEHPLGWGTDMPNEYFRYLRKKAVDLGLEVPYFFSGLHHSSDPAGEGILDDPKRPNPWLSTEFWSVWYNFYGSTIRDAEVYERRVWKVIARGGNGYNFYMAHGGTNFGYTNNDEDAASYDYGAAVGQAGDLRPVYYSFKRAGWFARSFREILGNSTDATEKYNHLIPDTAVHVTARHSPSGDIIFLDNPGNNMLHTKISKDDGIADSVTLNPGEIFPVVHNFPVTDLVTLRWSAVRLFGITRQGKTNTLVVYGNPRSEAVLYFSTKGNAVATTGKEGLIVKPHEVELRTTIASDDLPHEYVFTTGKENTRILVVNKELADRTWFVDNDDQSFIISGPSYAGDVRVTNKNVLVNTESPLQNKKERPSYIFSERNKQVLLHKTTVATKFDSVLTLASWQMNNASEAALPSYDDRSWKYSSIPLQMGADGDVTANAWYRTNVTIDSAGSYLLQVEGGDRATFFIDGVVAATGDLREGEIPLQLSKGDHSIAVFTAHDGRDKLAAYIGPIDSIYTKGLSGNAVLKKGNSIMRVLSNWKFLKASAKDVVNNGPPGLNAGWKNYKIGDDAFGLRQGFGWFQTSIEKPSENVLQVVLKFKSVDENATVFINDKRIYNMEGWNRPFNVVLDGLDTVRWPIILNVFIENYSNEGGIDQPVRLNTIGNAIPVTGWRMRGGPGDPDKTGKWEQLPGSFNPGKPYFFRTAFNAPAYSAEGLHTIWRVHTNGLGHGSVWVNGYNLGRYPEKTSAEGLYIPECWIKTGMNTLTIYDEDGMRPDKVSIRIEKAASSIIRTLTNH